MKKHFVRLMALLLAASMLAACGSNSVNTAGSTETTSAKAADLAGLEYPVTPDELGSGEVKWSEEKTADGWMKVTNDGGETLGYSPDSGVKLIQVGGFAFKDLNRNGKLDLYEDWRQEDETRVQDLVLSLSVEVMAGLTMHTTMFSMDENDGYTMTGEGLLEIVDTGLRAILTMDSSYPIEMQVNWNNLMQKKAESMDYGIPLMVTTNPRQSGWTNNLATSATFDTKLAKEIAIAQSKQLRAVGVRTLLGPAIDLATEPRWSHVTDSFSEDPALSRDMVNATISGLQSTFDENETDLGWGKDSVVAMMKHWPGNAAGEGGRESHASLGKYVVYPNGNFATGLIPFVDGALNLNSLTNSVAAAMTSYSVSWSDDESLGELVGSAFSEYKVSLLRSFGFDEMICTDFGIFTGETGYGVEELSSEERLLKAFLAGVDQFGGVKDINLVMSMYDLLKAELGEAGARKRLQDSATRILRTFFHVDVFENPYVSTDNAKQVYNDSKLSALAEEAKLKSIVMIKNSESIIKENAKGEKLTVYIPMQYTAGSGSGPYATKANWQLPVELSAADKYFNVVTDTVGAPTGPADEGGTPTLTEKDIVRPSAEELATCDLALVIVRNPQNVGGTSRGYDTEAKKYIPISLQYEPYTARSASVRTESLAGDMIETELTTLYGVQKGLEKENRSYYGETAQITNYCDLETIQYVAENMPEEAGIVVALSASNAMVVSEFEEDVDAILVDFICDFSSGTDTRPLLPIVAGIEEPSGLLPIQFPSNMNTVESQAEDTPRDMECYTDANGNTYDFGFGLNWSGVIQDARTEKYCVPPLTEPATQPVG